MLNQELEQYMKSIKKYNVIPHDKLLKMFEEYSKTKNEELYQTIINSNLRLVVKIAYSLNRMYDNNIMDLIQEGNYGLMIATKKFDYTKDIKFSTYAKYWIRSYMFNHIIKNKSMVKFLTTQNKRKVFFNSISAKNNTLDIDQKTIDEVLIGMATQYEDIDTIDIPMYNSPEYLYSGKECLLKLKKTLKNIQPTLSKRELSILNNKILNDDPPSFRELGEEFGISKQRVKQIEENLINKIKYNFNNI